MRVSFIAEETNVISRVPKQLSKWLSCDRDCKVQKQILFFIYFFFQFCNMLIELSWESKRVTRHSDKEITRNVINSRCALAAKKIAKLLFAFINKGKNILCDFFMLLLGLIAFAMRLIEI